jgi:hypothetical protein
MAKKQVEKKPQAKKVAKKAPKKPEAKKAPKKSTSKGTDNFQIAIKSHLEAKAKKDPLFAKTFAKKNKNIDDCITYILNTVKKSGQQGFADKDIYSMAIHYYDEDDIKPGASMSSGQIIVNHYVELTDKEKADAKQKAIDDLIAENKAQLKKKPEKKEKGKFEQGSLF